MKVTPREKQVIERFNGSLIDLEPNRRERPSDAELSKMSDAEVLAGDWLVDIEDTTFWNRWDEANANLTIDNGIKYYTPAKVAALVKSGLASYWPREAKRVKENEQWARPPVWSGQQLLIRKES